MGEKAYRPRRPQATRLWQCLHNHFEQFLKDHPGKYEKQYGKLRPEILEVVEKYLQCGDLTMGFARVVCRTCRQSYLLAFSCRCRWFCPSCHQKKVLQFGEFISQRVAYPVPHRHYVLTLPKMLRVYFKHDREMIGKLCEIAHESVRQYMGQALRKESGQAGMVVALQSFGEYLNAHPHIHAIVTDGLFMPDGMFYVMPRLSTQWLEEIFRRKVISMLVAEGKLGQELGRQLLNWKHSGFNVDHGQPVKREDKAGLERLSQYILRNPFSEDKMIYNREQQQVIYHSRLSKKTKRNFEVFTAAEFIAAITQHIPEKGLQLVRYYGWYSNKSRGVRAKAAEKPETKVIGGHGSVAKKAANSQWRALIQKIWEVDPLICGKCGSEMKIISFITEREVIEKILRHVKRWPEAEPVQARGSPAEPGSELTYEPYYDDVPCQAEA
jgi:hypothetical protein